MLNLAKNAKCDLCKKGDCKHSLLSLLYKAFYVVYYIIPPVRWECVISLMLYAKSAVYQGFGESEM